jgi:hypothetical protein
LYPYDASAQGALTFFDSEDCTGLSGKVFWDNKDTMVTLNDFKNHSIFFKDSITSVLIPKGYELEMWSDAQFTTSMGVLSTHSYLNDHDKVACQNIPESVNSYEIRKVRQQPAQGRWVQSRYNSDISQTLSTGIDMAATDKDRSEVVREIRSSLEAGFRFGTLDLTSQFQGDEERTVMQSVRQTMPKT